MAKKRRHKGARHHRVEIAPRVGGGRALEVNGVVQSIAVNVDDPARNEATDAVGARPVSPSAARSHPSDSRPSSRPSDLGYWELLLPPVGRCPTRALILGLGGGTVAALLSRRCPGVAIIGIERDETVLTLARLEFGLDEIPGLAVIVGDAFSEVALRTLSEPASYDYICLDLYDGERLASGTLANAFLRRLATLLTPGGLLAINLVITSRLDEQLQRLQRVFAVERQQRIRGNLVLHARARPAESQE